MPRWLTCLMLIPGFAWAGQIDVTSYLPVGLQSCVADASPQQRAQLTSWGWDSKVPIYSIETVQYAGGFICKFDLEKDHKHRFVVASLQDPNAGYEALYISPYYQDREAGIEDGIVDLHLLHLGSGKSKIAILALENGSEKIGAQTGVDRRTTKLSIFKAVKKVERVKVLEFSNYCKANREYGAKCEKQDKTPTDHGYESHVQWSLCEPSCNQLKIERTDLIHIKKTSVKLLSATRAGKVTITNELDEIK